MEVQGRPVIDYLFERLSFCKKLQKIVLATTTNREDDPVIEYSLQKGLPFFRGSENDVLDRYYQSALKFGIAHIMRITGDCPLIDPTICDRLVEAYLHEQVDYIVTAQTYAEGLDGELFSFAALETAWKDAKLRSERENVTQYFHNHSDFFKMSVLPNEQDDSKYRFTIDEKEDFVVVNAILEGLSGNGKDFFTSEDIKYFLDTHPDVYIVNSHIIRNEGLLKSRKNDHLV
jgi:spore coat polysaccharide biosynthesis protein SpsF (cytidylyltransferase family)